MRETGRALAAALGTLMAVACSTSPTEEEAPSAEERLEGYWGPEEIDPILERTLTVHLDTDRSALTPGESAALEKLLRVGELFQGLYESSRHHQARQALADLEALNRDGPSPRLTGDLLQLYRLSRGPIATTLDNQRVAFVPADAEVPGKNVYPWGIQREEVERFLEAHPDQRDALLDVRSVVRRNVPGSLGRDRGVLDAHPILDTLHPGLRHRLDSLVESDLTLYAVPYSVAYSDELLEAYGLLREAAELVEADDPDLADYLRLRARDLLADDYEGGNASWVSGDFRHLNAQIGSYETYDDELFGVKSFFSLSVLLRDEEQTQKLALAIGGLQSLQNSLPYDGTRKVRARIPVGVYNIIADFGQARSANTATILPNDPDHARKYGRTILMRANILRNPELFQIQRASFAAAVEEQFADDLTPDGNFERTLWHEIGHYLGADQTRDGRDMEIALEQYSGLLEEMKADLVSLFAAQELHRTGYLSDVGLRSMYASGVRRTLQRVKPRRSQPYRTMQLMQFNFYLENGLLRLVDGRLRINDAVYHNVVRSLLEQVLQVQESGNPQRAASFVERYGSWDEDVHGALAKAMQEASPYRWVLVRYAALGD